jgi:hypothetical protein
VKANKNQQKLMKAKMYNLETVFEWFLMKGIRKFDMVRRNNAGCSSEIFSLQCF